MTCYVQRALCVDDLAVPTSRSAQGISGVAAQR